jgi:hypothetical protein
MTPMLGIMASSRPFAKDYQGVVLADNPIGFWMLNETSGSTGDDLTANNNNMTFRNSPTLNVSTGLSGVTKAITFNGTDQVADTAIVATFNTNANSAWSSELWFKTTSTTSFASPGVWKGTGDVETAAFFFNVGGSGKVGVRAMDSAGSGFILIENATGTYNDGNWHYLCATSVSTGNMTLYVDGVSVASTSTARYGTNQNKQITAGANATAETSFANYFNGSLAAVAVYSTTLSGTQITKHYTEGL